MIEPAAPGRPLFTVIGANGVGKSTYAEGLAARGYPLGEVVNPDALAAALPGPDTTRDARAGRETLRRRCVLGNLTCLGKAFGTADFQRLFKRRSVQTERLCLVRRGKCLGLMFCS